MLVMLAATVTSMSLGYGLVMYLTEGRQFETDSTHQHIDEAKDLRRFSNTLLALATEYLSKGDRIESSKRAEFDKWSRNVFRPKVMELQRQIVASSGSSEALGRLAAAAEKLGSVAGGLAVDEAKKSLRSEVLRASTGAEDWIAQQNVGSYLGEPATIPTIRD